MTSPYSIESVSAHGGNGFSDVLVTAVKAYAIFYGVIMLIMLIVIWKVTHIFSGFRGYKALHAAPAARVPARHQAAMLHQGGAPRAHGPAALAHPAPVQRAQRPHPSALAHPAPVQRAQRPHPSALAHPAPVQRSHVLRK